MTDAVVVEFVKQGPGIAAVLLVVIMFIRHIRAAEERQSRREQEREASVQQMGDACHEVQQDVAEKVADALDRNTEAFGRNSAVLDRVERRLSEQAAADDRRHRG